METEATSADDRSETALDESLTSLEVLTSDRHLGLLGELPHSGDIHCGVGGAHDERSTLGEGCIGIAHRRSNMLAVVGLHGSLKVGKMIVNLLAYGYVDLGRCCPEHNDTGATVLLLEVADVLTKCLNHLPTSLAVLHVVAIKTLCVVLVEGSLHGFDGLELVLHRIDILLLEHLGIHSSLIGVLGIYIPATEDDVVEFCHWNDVCVRQIFLVITTTNTDFVILSHGSYGLCKSAACHKNTSHECCGYSSATNNHDT